MRTSTTLIVSLTAGIMAFAASDAVAQSTSLTVKLPKWKAACNPADADWPYRCNTQQAVTAATVRLTLSAVAAGQTISVQGPHDPAPVPFTVTQGQFMGIDTDSDPDRQDYAHVKFPDPSAVGIDAQRVEVTLLPLTDFSSAVSCHPETGVTAGGDWTISVSGGASFDSGCLLAFDQDTPSNKCSNLTRLIALDDPPYGRVIGGPDSVVQGCASDRPGVELMLVLDRSCSMGSSVGTGSGRRKIEALRAAVAELVTTWNTLRGTESMTCPVDATCPTGRRCSGSATPGVDAGCLPTGWACVGDLCTPGDRLGVAFFDGDAKTMAQIWPAPGSEWLPYTTFAHQPFDTIRPNLEASDLANASPGGSTSIGDGIEQAKLAMDSPSPRRKAMIVMSDGKQNTPRMVEVVSKATGLPIPSVATAPVIDAADYDIKLTGSGADITVPENIQLYTVTVGQDTAVDATINQAIARASGAYYLNVTDDATILAPMFEQALQSLMQFNTYQPLLWRRAALTASSPFTATLPVTSTSQSLEVTVILPPSNRTLVTAVLTSPSGRRIGREGTASIRVPVRGPEPGLWQVSVTPSQGPAVTADISSVADDLMVEAKFAVAPIDYAPGDDVVLTAKLTDGPNPLLSVGGGSGDRMTVRVGRPGQSLGELLSAISFTPTVDPNDPLSPAESKLQNLLAACSEAGQLHTLKLAARSETQDPCQALSGLAFSTVTLRDDGTGKDATANDGIYTGTFTAELVGHHLLFFEAEGSSKMGGRFAREHVESVHVRSIPSSDPADLQVTQSTGPGSRTLTIRPRTPSKKLMGPGFAHQFLFRSADGLSVYPLTDNLDGSYSAVVPSVGGLAPDVNIYFLRTFAKLGDDRRELIAQLGQTELKPLDVVKGGCSCADRGGAASGAAGSGAFVLLVLGLRRFGARRLGRGPRG